MTGGAMGPPRRRLKERPAAFFTLWVQDPDSVDAARERSRRLAAALGGAFDDLEVFCCFIGYPRSGHTLVGALLDAHPDVVIAQELHAVQLAAWGFDREQILALMVERTREFAAVDQRWTGYSYAVPGGWQGRWRTLRVAGDKRGGGTTHLLRSDPEALDRFRATISLPLRVIHVVRHPLDNITTMRKRRKPMVEKLVDLERSADDYFALAATVATAKQRLAGDELLELRLEDLSASPREELTRLAAFLGVDADPDWLDACVEVVQPVRASRDDGPWTAELVADVGRRAAAFPWLAGYEFEGGA